MPFLLKSLLKEESVHLYSLNGLIHSYGLSLPCNRSQDTCIPHLTAFNILSLSQFMLQCMSVEIHVHTICLCAIKVLKINLKTLQMLQEAI